MTNAILRGKPDAGNPHVRFDEGEVASAKPRRGSLLYKHLLFASCLALAAFALSAHAADADYPEWIPIEPQITPVVTSVDSDTLGAETSFWMFWRTSEIGKYPVPGFLLLFR